MEISAIIPTHNAEAYLLDTLNSIAKQTHLPDEVIISDDYSSDSTLSIAQKFKDLADFNIIIIHNQPQGPTKNYLNAIKFASGNIIIVADQDDVWVNNKVELTIKAFENDEVSLVCHDSLLVNENLESLNKTIRENHKKSYRLCKKINDTSNEINFEYFLKGGLPLLAHTLSFRKNLVPLLLSKPIKLSNGGLNSG